MFIVTDSNNSASELRPLVRLCPCQNGGHCVDDEDVQRQLDTGVRFIVLSCQCPSGLTGQFCESNFDACVESNDPCFPGVKCTNVPLNVSNTGYTCGPCPSGYHGDGDGASCVGKTDKLLCTNIVKGKMISFYLKPVWLVARAAFWTISLNHLIATYILHLTGK